MDFPAVLAQINDVPPAFRPAGNPFAQWATSVASALAVFTNGADALMKQVLSFDGAIDGWIDVWGLLFGVARSGSEGNIPYATRITETVLAWVGTLPALQVWVNLFAPGGTVTENASGLGYAISLPAYMTAAQALAFLQSLARIRPAGVPFTVSSSSYGLYLDAQAFLEAGTDYSTYLTVAAAGNIGLGATTCSSQPLLPSLLLSDPLLNPATSVWPGFSVSTPYVPGTVVSPA